VLSTAQALAATILVAVIVLPPVFWLYSSSPDASPLTPQIVGNLLVTCDMMTVGDGEGYVNGDLPADPGVTYYFTSTITRLYTNITLTVKNTLGEHITIDHIIPMGVNISALGINLTYHVNPGVATTIETPVVWTRDVKLYAPIAPGDVWMVSGGILKKVEDGRIVVVNNVPDNPPVNYTCPLGTIYDLEINGKNMLIKAEEPGCAPTKVASLPSKFFMVTAFTPLDYLYDMYDVTFYAHVYTGVDEVFAGIAFLGGPGNGSGYVDLQVLGSNTSSYYPPPVSAPVPLLLEYDAGSITAYFANGTHTSDVATGNVTELYIGLARQVPAKSKIQVALVLDSSASMVDDWESLVAALARVPLIH